MKKIKLFMVVCLLGIAATASAQFANSSSNSSADASAWKGIRASYLPISIKADGGGSVDFTGFQVGYVKSFAISANAPLFIETGANLSYISGDFEMYDGYDAFDVDMNMFSINVPINFGYQVAISETANIFPYVGATLRGNLFGKYKEDDESFSIFDSENEEFGMQAKRFQIGWQIGAAATFNNFVVGVSYGTDFNDIIEDCKITTTAISIGFNF